MKTIEVRKEGAPPDRAAPGLPPPPAPSIFLKPVAILAILFMAAAGHAVMPPRHTGDPAADENFREIFRLLATHSHQNDGSVKISPSSSSYAATAGSASALPLGSSITDSIGGTILISDGNGKLAEDTDLLYSTFTNRMIVKYITTQEVAGTYAVSPAVGQYLILGYYGYATGSNSGYLRLLTGGSATHSAGDMYIHVGTGAVNDGTIYMGAGKSFMWDGTDYQVKISTNGVYVSSLNVSGTGDFGGAVDVDGALSENTNRVFSGASMFESSTQTIVTSSNVFVAHGLGHTPSIWSVSIRCISADAGYSVGDEVMWPVSTHGSQYSTEDNNESMVYANSTYIGYVTSDTGIFQVRRPSDSARVAIDNSKWGLVFRAWY